MTPPLGSQDLTVALRVIEALEDLAISYHLGGSVASSIHGTPRQTRDIDIAVDLPLSAVPTLVGRLQGEFYLDDERIRAAVQRQSSFNLIHLETGLKIDIFIRHAEPFDRSEGEKLDRPYLRSWAEDLQVADLLERALGEAGQSPVDDPPQPR